jgi:hypothetical protein
VRRGAHHENPPDGARRNRLVRGAIARIEPSLEPDLDEDPGARDILEHAVKGREVEGDRLLGEGRKARSRREP